MIWKVSKITLEELNANRRNTLAETLDMQFTAIGDDYLKMQMPVNTTTHQPYGLLHGGASAALAETVGSVAAWLCLNNELYWCVGIELNCNHIRGKKTGVVTATARPFHIGVTTQVWEIKIEDEKERLICVSRLTVANIKKQEQDAES